MAGWYGRIWGCVNQANMGPFADNGIEMCNRILVIYLIVVNHFTGTFPITLFKM